MFFTYFWNKLLFGPQKPSIGICVGFAITACLAALAHNFSAAQAGLIFLTGLFFLKKERRRAYWLSGIGALLLYSPNIPIFYHQTFVNGGIGGWLDRPESSFLPDFLQYTMNYAPLFMFATGILIVLPLILQKPEKRPRPVRWLGLIWFVVILAMAWIYSLLREPILQFSTLYFCYPFLVIAAFSFHKNNSMTMTQTTFAVVALLFIGTSSLIINRQHYDLMYHQGYDQIAERMKQDNDSLNDIRFATLTPTTLYADFYQAQTHVTRRSIFEQSQYNTADFRQWLDAENSSMLGFGWTDYLDPSWEAQAVAYYPWKLYDGTWFTSRYLTLAKDAVADAEYLLHPLSNQPQTLINMEWCTPLYIHGDSLDRNTDLLGVIATVQTTDTIHDCVLVMEIHDVATDTLVQWCGNTNESGTLLPGTNVMAYAIRFDPKKFPIQGKKIKTFLWNKRQGAMTITRFDYYCTRFNSRLTGLYHPL